MEGVHMKGGRGEARPQLLELIPSKREWMVRDRGGGGELGSGYAVGAAAAAAAVEKQLELRLGPPGGVDDGLSSASGGSCRDTKMVATGEPSSLLSLGGLFSSSSRPSGSNNTPSKRGFLDTLEDCKEQAYQPQKAGFFGAGACKEEAGAGHKAAADGGHAEQQQRPGERMAVTSPAPSANAAAVNDRSQTRTSQPPVVGWPPIRSFRKNIATAASSSKSPSCSPAQAAEHKPESCRIANKNSSRLVKINMDGVPIGRKVDLGACSGYDRLSAAVDQLFRGLLAAQRVIKDHGNNSGSLGSQQESTTPAITGLLDGSGEYTLVYEDNEGDRMLAGDIPWEMFVSTVKRLRVLKTSELPSLSLGVAGGTRRKAPAHRDRSSSSSAAAQGAAA